MGPANKVITLRTEDKIWVIKILHKLHRLYRKVANISLKVQYF